MPKKYETATVKTLLDSFEAFYRKHLNDDQFERFVELMAVHPEHIDGDEEEGVGQDEWNDIQSAYGYVRTKKMAK